MKTCTKCKQEFPATLEYFHKNGKFFRSSCKSCRNAVVRDYYETNLDKIMDQKKIYYQANSEKVKAIVKAWAKANPEKRAVSDRRRRARKLGNGFEPYTLKEIFELYGTNCYLCDMPINYEVSGHAGSNPQWRSGLNIEHFIDIDLGGPDTLENVRPSHAWCNLTKVPKINN